MLANKHLYPKLVIFICLLLLIITTAVYAEETLRVAKVTGFTGKVDVMKAGGEKTFPVFIGMGLVQGDRIITGQNSALTLELDGNEKEVKIAENSNLLISELTECGDSQEETSRFSLWAGGIWADIKNKLTSGSRFEIKTPTAVMGARGTKIYVSQNGDKTTYTVISGSAYVNYTINIPEPDGNIRQMGVELVLNEQQMLELHGIITDPNAVTIREVSLQSLDLFVLEMIKELEAANPGTFDSEFLAQLDELIEKMTEAKNQLEKQDQRKENLAPVIEYISDLLGGSDGGGGGSSPPPIALLTVPVLSLAQNITVDGEIELTFTDDAAWRAAITSIKIGETELESGTDYAVAAGTITLKPAGGNILLTTTGVKLLSVEATGYETAQINVTILPGALLSANCTATIDPPLASGSESTVTVTALDRHGNSIQGHKFHLVIVVNDIDQTNDEVYTISGIDYVNNNPFPYLPKAFTAETGETGVNGKVSFNVKIPAEVDKDDGVSITVMSADGGTIIGTLFTYYGSASNNPPPVLLVPPVLSAAPNQTVDNVITITFADDAAWRAAITSVKIDETTLVPVKDYSIASGTITLKPTGGSPQLRTAGDKAVSVEAAGFDAAQVNLTIHPGTLHSPNCTATIDPPLDPGATGTVTATALDQYGNPIQGRKFHADIEVKNHDQTHNEIYTINGTDYINDNPSPYLPKTFTDETGETDANGKVTFGIEIPAEVDKDDGVSVTVMSSDGGATIGNPFTYYGSGGNNPPPVLLVPPVLSADSNQTVDDEITITFTDDVAWRAAITSVKIDGSELVPVTDYDVAVGTATLKPVGGNALLTTAGDKAVSVEATGFDAALLNLTILPGALHPLSCTATIAPSLALDVTGTVTVTALDRYGNTIQGHKFHLVIVVNNFKQTNIEEYVINEITYKNTNSFPYSPKTYTAETGETDTNGNVTFTIKIPPVVDIGDGISVTVRSAAGGAIIGIPFTYYRT